MRALADTLISWGPTGLLIFAILDGMGLPIPGGVDALLVFLASRTPEFTYQLALLAVVGSTLGNLFLFSLARKGGEVYLERRTPSRGGARFRRWFYEYGLLTVFISALVPLPIMPMKIFVICAGALGSNLWSFVASFFTARILRYMGLAYLGSQMGDGALPYLKENALYLALFAVLLFVVLFVLIKASERFRKKRATGPA